MENNRRENFDDILKTVADLKSRLDELERRIEEYRSAYGDPLQAPLAEEIEFEHEDFLGDMSELVTGSDEIIINADIPEEEAAAAAEPEMEVAAEPGQDQESEQEIEAEPEYEPEAGQDAEPELEPEPEPEPEAEAEPENDEPFSLFGEMFAPSPAPVKKPSRSRTLNDMNSSRASGAVIDLKTDKPAWSLDMPGPEVRDVRSAISLNDRVMFISTLFREDSMLFQDVVGHINGMSDLNKVVAYLQTTFPEWDMSSDAVYRFMMAVRRKIR